MTNIKLTIEYHGLPYCGWQYQKNEKTVQGEIEKAIFKFSGEKKTIQGAGRTDAGVHALAQCANFELEKKFDEYQILNGINFHLGTEKIRITKVENVDQEFNARFTAKSKIYNYQVFNSQAPSVIEDDFSIHIRQPLDLEAMQNAIQLFLGNHDFSSFRASGCNAKSPIKLMKLVKIKKLKSKIEFEFRSQSFLKQQVRSMVGCLKFIGEKKWSIKKFVNVIKAKNRKLCAPPAPAEGLYLVKVKY